MTDLISIKTAFSNIKIASDIIKGILSIKSMTEINEKAIELQGIILSLQDKIFDIQKEYSEIYDKYSEISNWTKNIASHYSLYDTGEGKFVYALKQEFVKPDEPMHWICAQCFNERKKSILQAARKDEFAHSVQCPICKFYVFIELKPEPSIQSTIHGKDGWMAV
jgi:rubrerythrin